jgi:pantoate--beta-alanine ligase
MKIFKDKYNLKKKIYLFNRVSFVPTMGGLHNGHKYLIKNAKKKGSKVIVSIFVNPKQFNSKKDFKYYPRNLNQDLKVLKKLNVDYVYLPNIKDIFSFKTNNKIFIDKFSQKLCGKFRKKHFRGVVNVVNRFLEIIKPKYIHLGEKDFQQLYLIKQHIKKKKINTIVCSCKTIREENGIAHSTRNYLLTKNQKKKAAKIYKLLRKEKKLINFNKFFNKKIKLIKKKIIELGASKIDYLECLNLKTLNKPRLNSNKFNFFIAYYIGKVRLIDNF